jgi:monoterpene epsilon-lactone hydrolase
MEDLREERKRFGTLGLSYPSNDQVKVEPVTLAGVQNYWFTPASIASTEIIIFLHGGGFMYGSVQSHRALVSHLAAATGRKFLFVEYSLAPEKPFPHALNETIAVIKTLLKEIPGVHFALMGDSAGGNLAMSTALKLNELDLPEPLYQVLISPWVNMKTDYASYAENEKLDPIITKEFVNYAASNYAGDHDLSDPFISPVLGSFSGFNPTLTMVGANEILRDDSVHLHQALQKGGGTSVLKIVDNVTHVWILTNIASQTSNETLKTIRDFMNSVTKSVYSQNSVEL